MRISRSIVLGMFGMLAGGGAFAAACDGFTDVDSGNATYCPAVTYLKSKGITLGCTGTTYCPNDYVTRLQMALFLQRVGRGGADNTLGDWTDTISGGSTNIAEFAGDYSVVAGGLQNLAVGFATSVGGGTNNQSTASFATVGGGIENVAGAIYSTVGGGVANGASGIGSSVPGGFQNIAGGNFSAALGGDSNSALGDSSVVLGHAGGATVAAPGSFVFSDSTDRSDLAQFGANAPNLFVVGASGGIQMYTNKDYSTSCKLLPGGGTWSCSSSKDVKRDFSEVDVQDVLDRVAALPVQRWRYKNEAPEIRHMGTFAQDFHEAFGLGADDKAITMADADGVALAAIQALHARLKDKDAQIDALNHRLEAIEAMLKR